MLHALGPAQVADVDQAVDTVFDLDERAEVGEVAHASFDLRSNREFLVQAVPGIGGKLAHAQRNAALGRIHVEHHALHLVADIDQFRGMLHALRPGHLADVHQAFDALLELHERAIVGHADHAAADVRSHRVTLFGIEPGIGRSEEHTSELQSHLNLVCRLLLEKIKKPISHPSLIKTNQQYTPTLVL